MSEEHKQHQLQDLLKKGEFTQVANEMLEYLAKMNLTPTEFKICFYLIRELVGWDYNFKPIEISAFMSGTNSSERAIQEALKRLVKEKILLKHKVPDYRTPCYGFNPDKFGRVNITEPRSVYIEGEKVIDLKAFKLMKLRGSAALNDMGTQFRDAQVRTQKRQDRATRAAAKTPKYTQTHLNIHSEGNLEISEWQKIKEKLLLQFPKDANRLEGTYQQIKKNGFEQEGRVPRIIENLPRWLLTSYKDIRNDYCHHDSWRQKA